MWHPNLQIPGITPPGSAIATPRVLRAGHSNLMPTLLVFTVTLYSNGCRRKSLPAHLRESTGSLLGYGSTEPLYLQPMYQTATARHKNALQLSALRRKADMAGLVPGHEDMHYNKLFTHEYMRPPMTRADMDGFCTHLKKCMRIVSISCRKWKTLINFRYILCSSYSLGLCDEPFHYSTSMKILLLENIHDSGVQILKNANFGEPLKSKPANKDF